MAVPRVFVSSTFYDLKQVRDNIGDFIRNLGYEPVMHEMSGVTYTQNVPLQNDCYHELVSCDIIVCIIGNHFGSQSIDNDCSITMNEINNAIRSKKKVYIFISKDVFIENRTYEKNKDAVNFKSAYTDNIKIHEFISDLKNTNRFNVIEAFETTDDIIYTLKLQFAGLFQNLLIKDSSATNEKTAYDLQQSVDQMKEIISDFESQKEDFFAKFDSSIIINNRIAYKIKTLIGMRKSAFFAADIDALDEFMNVVGFESVKVEDCIKDVRKYEKDSNDKIVSIILKKSLLNDDKTFIKSVSQIDLDDLVIYNERIKEDDNFPF